MKYIKPHCRSTFRIRPKRKTKLYSFKYKGFLVTIVNTHMWGRFRYEWEMVPLSPKAKALADGKKKLYDPTSWVRARGQFGAKYQAKLEINTWQLRHKWLVDYVMSMKEANGS